jgi:hypothetical protein
MIDIGQYNRCACSSRHRPHQLCDGKLRFEENGIKVTLIPRSQEQALAIVLDGCVCTDDRTKCDGLFLFAKGNRKWMILVELKGGELEHAFEQLAFMKSRQEYREIYTLFCSEGSSHPIELAFIISNYLLSTIDHQKLEESNGIRVKRILQSAATRPIPNLRKYLY